VRRGKTALLRYRVGDAACPQVTTTIRLYKAGKLVKAKGLGCVATGRTLTWSFHCTLARGVYVWKVSATDLAGNTQVKQAARRLTVK
jgi:hypothetical protein